MTNRFVLVAMALLLGFSFGCSKEAPVQEQAPAPAPTPATETPDEPNVVLLILDTVRADRLSCYGFDEETTPALDRYANEGVLFENTFTQCTWTRPSIGSMITSLYPRTLGLFIEKDQALNERFTTLAEIMFDAGYATFGLTANPNINIRYNFHQGFEKYVDSNILFSWMEEESGQVKRGKQSLPPANALLNQAFDYMKAGAEAGKPCFVQVDLMEAHEWTATRPGTNMLRPEYEALEFKNKTLVGRYYKLLRQLSDDVAAFVEKVTAQPSWEDTVFVFVSDHGEGLDSHPSVNPSKHHGKLMYASQAKVPWIIYQKGLDPKVQRVQQDVRLLEVMPTLLDLLGMPVPEGIEGHSMMPVVRGEVDDVPLPEMKVIESYFKGADIRGVYGADYKYIQSNKPNRGAAKEELQKRNSPENGRRTNVLKEHPEIAAPLKDHWQDWEAAYPKAEPTPVTQELSEEELLQLKSIGYL